MSYVIACSKLWVPDIAQQLERLTDKSFTLITKREELSKEHLEQLNPKQIFFPHWSYIIPPIIYENFECTMFHMTDLPKGRGGSPLQNLIVQGNKTTKISAFKCDNGIDTGPIYLKKDLDLSGTAQEIFTRAGHTIIAMIAEIVKTTPEAIPQTGDPTYFKRRTPEQGNISSVENLETMYDYIRMLDGEGYPNAFLKTQHFRLEFSGAELTSEGLFARVKVTYEKQ